MEKNVDVYRYEVSLEVGAVQSNVPRTRLLVKRAPTTPQPGAISGTEAARERGSRGTRNVLGRQREAETLYQKERPKYNFVTGTNKEVTTWPSVHICMTNRPLTALDNPSRKRMLLHGCCSLRHVLATIWRHWVLVMLWDQAETCWPLTDDLGRVAGPGRDFTSEMS